jgi:hypothetical protein
MRNEMAALKHLPHIAKKVLEMSCMSGRKRDDVSDNYREFNLSELFWYFNQTVSENSGSVRFKTAKKNK